MINKFEKIESIVTKLFDKNIELFHSVNELFELELAFLEFNCLPSDQLLNRTAYIKSKDNFFSKHYLLYVEQNQTTHQGRTSATLSYFKEGQFSTGYATHGLFPYRGKFHPQLIKGLLNILQIEPNDTVLDPMAGSGTTNIEAALLGINSIAIDVSPFCQFMIQTKYEALLIEPDSLQYENVDFTKFFDYFIQGNVLQRISKIDNLNKRKVSKLIFLAFLDALGYSKRVIKSNHEQLFVKVLNRYLNSVKEFITNPHFTPSDIGKMQILSDSDALHINLPEQSVDCVITSPPYSFAIDYVENDKDQLEFLGYNSDELKNQFIGLKGKTKSDKIQNYFEDMDTFCQQVSKVLKKDKFFILIIGSNTNQTGGIRLEEKIIQSAKSYNMPLIKSIQKPIEE